MLNPLEYIPYEPTPKALDEEYCRLRIALHLMAKRVAEEDQKLEMPEKVFGGEKPIIVDFNLLAENPADWENEAIARGEDFINTPHAGMKLLREVEEKAYQADCLEMANRVYSDWRFLYELISQPKRLQSVRELLADTIGGHLRWTPPDCPYVQGLEKEALQAGAELSGVDFKDIRLSDLKRIRREYSYPLPLTPEQSAALSDDPANPKAEETVAAYYHRFLDERVKTPGNPLYGLDLSGFNLQVQEYDEPNSLHKMWTNGNGKVLILAINVGRTNDFDIIASSHSRIVPLGWHEIYAHGIEQGYAWRKAIDEGRMAQHFGLSSAYGPEIYFMEGRAQFQQLMQIKTKGPHDPIYRLEHNVRLLQNVHRENALHIATDRAADIGREEALQEAIDYFNKHNVTDPFYELDYPAKAGQYVRGVLNRTFNTINNSTYPTTLRFFMDWYDSLPPNGQDWLLNSDAFYGVWATSVKLRNLRDESREYFRSNPGPSGLSLH